jgi:hypothetical protein
MKKNCQVFLLNNFPEEEKMENGTIVVVLGTFSGMVIGKTEDGRLIVQTVDGERVTVAPEKLDRVAA